MVPVHNKTPFAVQLFAFADLDGQEVLLLVVCATFSVDRERVHPSEPQPPVRGADEYHGDPAASSVRFEADVALEKPHVDVLVDGVAHAPRGRAVRSLEVALHVGDVHKQLVVYGDRRRRIGGSASDPEPFVSMPIVYERSFGGFDRRDPDPRKHKLYPQNPVGVAFNGSPAVDPAVVSEFPNVEYPNGPVIARTGIPAGFGVLGRGWSPRRELAGTFDEQWLKNQWPLLPRDFRPEHYQAAPFDQQSRGIRGGEDVLLTNATPDGDWRLRLPMLDIPIRLCFADRVELADPKLDTVLLRPEDRLVTLSCRVRIPVRRDRRALKEIIVGNASMAWLRAYETGKRYVDLHGTDGVDMSKPAWH